MRLLNRILKTLIVSLFLITPLLFSFSNSELFEIPKIHFIYLITNLIITFHLINWSLGRTQLFHRHFLNWPILLFLISQIICAFNSIDIYTSIHGYYSRLNGGLISIMTFSSLFFIVPLYLDEKFKKTIINFFLFSGLLVSLYGILEHFGIDKNLWVQDVQSRVFSTLGQPNWLAAYLCILLPFSINKYLKSKSYGRIMIRPYIYLFLTLTFYTTLLFTKSKSGILAAVISIGLFFLIKIISNLRNRTNPLNLQSSILIFIFIILSITISNPIKDKIFFTRLNTPALDGSNTNQQTNINITSSEDIRKIVWRGSLDLFKKFPILGTGVETFAYSYYWTRPIEHNLTSEWDFLYNKAHNEYLNYLATTGLVGTIPYLILIFTVLFYLIKQIFNSKNSLEIKNLPVRQEGWSLVILCSYVSILITNAAGFSVAIISLFFFLLPIFSFTKNTPPKHHLKSKKIFIPIILLFSFRLIQNVTTSYLADIYFAKSQTADNHQDYQTAYQFIFQSHQLRQEDPNYLINLGLLSAKMAILTKDSQYTDQATKSAELATTASPANINFWKQKAQIYYYLASLDQNYFIETINAMISAANLAPTDAKIYFNLGQFLETASLTDDAVVYYQKAIDLKSNYDHAYFALGKIYFDQKKYDLAQKNLELTLQYAPTNSEAQKILDKINQTNK